VSIENSRVKTNTINVTPTQILNFAFCFTQAESSAKIAVNITVETDKTSRFKLMSNAEASDIIRLIVSKMLNTELTKNEILLFNFRLPPRRFL
jgi:superfamily II DNA or RNA helicase